MAKKKRQFHCEKCSSPCEIYKKGKKHRVLVCPRCGVIATNPIPLLAAAAPFLVQGAKSLIEGRAQKSDAQAERVIVKQPSDRFTTEERIGMALR